MGVGVARELVALGGDVADEVRIVPGRAADDEERGLGLVHAEELEVLLDHLRETGGEAVATGDHRADVLQVNAEEEGWGGGGQGWFWRGMAAGGFRPWRRA